MKALLACLVALHLPMLGVQVTGADASDGQPDVWGPSGRSAHYVRQTSGLKEADTRAFAITWGPVEHLASGDHQWLALEGEKVNGAHFRVWLLTAGYPAETRAEARLQIARFLFQQGSPTTLEFKDRTTGQAVLPSVGGWSYLFPHDNDPAKAQFSSRNYPRQTRYLGQTFQLEEVDDRARVTVPTDVRVVLLKPDVLVGVASNTRQKDETRRYDGSEYDLIRLGQEDFKVMFQAGINCMKVDSEQRPCVDELDVFYWGIGGKDVPFPECLYDSRYLGPTLFLDEPAVGTRDHVLRPRLEKEPAFRSAVNPQIAFEAFREYFGRALRDGAAISLTQSLFARGDIDLGDMRLRQENLFSWETMVSTASYQLSQDSLVPEAMVFEPPGRVGALRTIPELNMTYGCQLSVDDPKNLADIIYGFLRGAARATGKQWGISIYGAVDRADAFWFLTHAYDLGATRFFFWDNAQLACVPFHECLALARAIRMRAENHPERDLGQLLRAGEAAILLPPGYNLGHVHLGKGSLWGVGELNLERLNSMGVPYRRVMSNFFLEIERCLRMGVAFDLLTDWPGTPPIGYREVVRIREDGKVEVEENGKRSLLDQARTPARPGGAPPELSVELSTDEGKAPLAIRAQATVIQTAAPVYYTFGADNQGVYHNAMAAWEIYGPGPEDYVFLTPPGLKPRVVRTNQVAHVTVDFTLRRPGQYQLRTATVDRAGRTSVHWTPIVVKE